MLWSTSPEKMKEEIVYRGLWASTTLTSPSSRVAKFPDMI